MKATHAPHLPYPCHPWPNNCSGHVDASQCVLREPSIITQEDISRARDHLRRHLSGDNGTKAHNTRNELTKDTTPDHPHTQISHLPRRAKNKPIYNLDALSKIDTFITTQRLWTLRKHNNFNVGIGLSCIPSANRGLFTTKERDGSEYLCPYLGNIEKRKDNPHPTGEYTFYDQARDQYVHGNPATSYGPYSNDPLNEQLANAKISFRKEKNGYWLQALGPIARNSEILTMYGADFWIANNIVPTEIINIAYPIHLRRAARCVSEKEQC
jgi:hypothetical protein